MKQGQSVKVEGAPGYCDFDGVFLWSGVRADGVAMTLVLSDPIGSDRGFTELIRSKYVTQVTTT